MTLTPLCRSYVSERERGKKGIRRYVIAQDMSVRSKFMFFFVTRLSLTLRRLRNAQHFVSSLSASSSHRHSPKKKSSFGSVNASTQLKSAVLLPLTKGKEARLYSSHKLSSFSSVLFWFKFCSFSHTDRTCAGLAHTPL